MNNFADSAGNRFHVDGHMMYAGTTLFAATRAWKWQHGFKSSDLQVQVINAAAEAAQLDQGTAQSIMQPSWMRARARAVLQQPYLRELPR